MAKKECETNGPEIITAQTQSSGVREQCTAFMQA